MSYPWNQGYSNTSQSQMSANTQMSDGSSDQNATATQDLNNWQEDTNVTLGNENAVEEQYSNKAGDDYVSRGGKRDTQKNYSSSNYNSPKSLDRRQHSGSMQRDGSRRYGGSRDKYNKDYSRSSNRDTGSRYKHKQRRRSRSRSRSRTGASKSRSRSRSRSYKTKRNKRSRSRSNGRRRRYSTSSESSSNSGSQTKRSSRRNEKSGNSHTEYSSSGTTSSRVLLDAIPYVEPVPAVTVTPFKNDGSFLEMFKKMQSETLNKAETKPTPQPAPVIPIVGKRRGGRVLKTGVVEKLKPIEDIATEEQRKDPWSIYMQEVKKYREASCQDESKTRPLVK